MNDSKYLSSIEPAPFPVSGDGSSKRLELGRPAGLSPARSAPRPGLRLGLLFLLLVILGCGATAPCPTPTTELDRLRAESERLENEMEEASIVEGASDEEREEALRRLSEAQAALDSIADARGR